MSNYKYGILSFIATYLIMGYIHVRGTAFAWVEGITKMDKIMTYIKTAIFEGILVKSLVSLIIATILYFIVNKVKNIMNHS